ncbi:hypothetical protein NDU88_002803 [Pleurodeles waltl]|uniref:Uncharacterized protein n=1 Tax=Pleurodeles waltl TaxID=8319 RepID=A0AAV7W0Q0_PLEWA|nr:hypothetical protein NDU88_002803 [Pleurodeles waltl]
MMMYSSIKILYKKIAIGTQVLLQVAYLSLDVIVIREKAQVTPSIRIRIRVFYAKYKDSDSANKMDFDDNREALLGDLFLKNITRSKMQSTNMTNKDGLKVKFVALEKLKKQELAKWWDGATLKKYMENKCMPRGLRILIFPNFEDLEVDLLQEWEEGLHEASYKVMNILVTNSERKVKKLREEINRLEKELKELNLMEATQKNYEILKKELSCYQLYLKDKKLKKIN